MNCCTTFSPEQRVLYTHLKTDRCLSLKQAAISITIALATLALVGSVLCLVAQQGVDLAGFNAISAMINPMWPAIAGGFAAGVIISSLVAATALSAAEKCYPSADLKRWGIDKICTEEITLKMPTTAPSFWCEDFILPGKSASVFVLYVQVLRGERMAYQLLGFKNSADRQERVEQLRSYFVDANNWDAHNPTGAMVEAFKEIPFLLRDFWFWKTTVQVHRQDIPVLYYKLPNIDSVKAHPFENGSARRQFLNEKGEWKNGRAAWRNDQFQFSYADICAFVSEDERKKWDQVKVLEGTYFASSLNDRSGCNIYAYALKTADNDFFFANLKSRQQKIEELQLLNAKAELNMGCEALQALDPYLEELENIGKALFPDQFFTRDFKEYGMYVLITDHSIRYFSCLGDRQIVQNYYEKTRYSLNELEELIEAQEGSWKIETLLPLSSGFVITKYLKIHEHNLTLVYYRNQKDLIVYNIFMDNAPIGNRAIDFIPENEFIHAFVYPLANEDVIAIKQKAARLRIRNKDEYLTHKFENSGMTFIALIVCYSMRVSKPIVNVLYMTEEGFANFKPASTLSRCNEELL